jgi:hypothetical protein
LFKFTDGSAREFHPGDKYAISIPKSEVHDTLKSYVTQGKLQIKLGVIKKDGSIEIMVDAAEDWFLFKGEAADFVSGTDNKKPRVFNASSSGSLILIVNIVTLDSFNLLREYDLNADNETVEVKFTGKGTRDQ